jgi:hypothetical protein
LRVVRPAFLRHWRRLVKEPFTLGGMVFMKFSEAAAGGLGFAYASLAARRDRN